MKKIPDEDKHVYVILSAVLVVGSILVFVFDPQYTRAIMVTGFFFTGAGAYLIGSGVVPTCSNYNRIE